MFDSLGERFVCDIRELDGRYRLSSLPWTHEEFPILPGDRFGISINGAGCYGYIRGYRTRADMTLPLEVPALESGGPLKSDAMFWLEFALLSLSMAQKSQVVTKSYTAPKRTLIVEYPSRDAPWGRKYVDFSTSNTSIIDWLTQCHEDSRPFHARKMPGTVAYNIACTAREDMRNWAQGYVPFDGPEPRSDENLARFLLSHKHNDRLALDRMVDRMRSRAAAQQRILILGPDSYASFLLGFSFNLDVCAQVHDRFMRAYDIHAESSPRVQELRAVRDQLKEHIDRVLAEQNVGTDEMRVDISVKTPFRVKVLSDRHPREAYEDAYQRVIAGHVEQPLQLPDSLRRLGFYVRRKCRQLKNVTSFALMKIRPNDLLYNLSSRLHTTRFNLEEVLRATSLQTWDLENPF